jgi:ATP-dependent Clp protease ATP-binding subunit ClpC
MPEPSPALGLVWQVAAFEASEAALDCIEPEQFFIALCKTEEMINDDVMDEAKTRNIDLDALRAELAFVPEVLKSFKVDPVRFRRLVRSQVTSGSADRQRSDLIHRSEKSRDIFAQAEELAQSAACSETTTAHLFLALLDETDSKWCRVLRQMGVDLKALFSAANRGAEQLVTGTRRGQAIAQDEQAKSTPFLTRYGRDLTKEAAEGKIGPIIGRRKILLQVIQTLTRRTKNNPVLVGEAGVGKTAICEALAIRIAQGKDPHVLAGRRIVELNMGTLVGGTKFRGEFEERLRRIVEEAQSHPEVILFIDEIHTVVGAGKSEGGLDAANLLKPGLARGDLRCIGATTLAEYRRHIESDSALERRFEKILVNEPTREETLEILQGLKSKWEEHHSVIINERALTAAADLSIRFDTEHQLPDKAIDIIDKACTRIRVPRLSLKAEMFNLKKGSQPCWGEVTEDTVAEVVSEKTEIPFDIVRGHFAGTKATGLLGLEKSLKKKIIGQDAAIEKLSKKLLLAYTGLLKKHGPIGVFLFAGPSGVGKTALAAALAASLFGNEEEMIRLDMTEYTEDHSLARLIGSPPGYVGYEEQGQLTGKIRTRPYSVILLDEVEKASPKVLDLFLQLFDEGRLTDARGRTADARNAVFILTSNLAAEKRMGFRSKDKEKEGTAPVMSEIKRRFPSEFLNRVDEVILFQELTAENMRQILDNRLEEMRGMLREKHNIGLEVTPKAKDLLTHEALKAGSGARELDRTLERLLQLPVAELVAGGHLRPGATLRCEVHAKELKVLPRAADGEG